MPSLLLQVKQPTAPHDSLDASPPLTLECLTAALIGEGKSKEVVLKQGCVAAAVRLMRTQEPMLGAGSADRDAASNASREAQLLEVALNSLQSATGTAHLALVRRMLGNGHIAGALRLTSVLFLRACVDDNREVCSC